MADRDQNRVVRDVRVPAPHEGVGNALRGAYGNVPATLPPEMARLLGKLL